LLFDTLIIRSFMTPSIAALMGSVLVAATSAKSARAVAMAQPPATRPTTAR